MDYKTFPETLPKIRALCGSIGIPYPESIGMSYHNIPHAKAMGMTLPQVQDAIAKSGLINAAFPDEIRPRLADIAAILYDARPADLDDPMNHTGVKAVERLANLGFTAEPREALRMLMNLFMVHIGIAVDSIQDEPSGAYHAIRIPETGGGYFVEAPVATLKGQILDRFNEVERSLWKILTSSPQTFLRGDKKPRKRPELATDLGVLCDRKKDKETAEMTHVIDGFISMAKLLKPYRNTLVHGEVDELAGDDGEVLFRHDLRRIIMVKEEIGEKYRIELNRGEVMPIFVSASALVDAFAKMHKATKPLRNEAVQ